MKNVRKSFNVGSSKSYPIQTIPWTLIAVGLIWALPAIWQSINACMKDDIARIILPMIPRGLPPLDEVKTQVIVVIALAALAAWIISCWRSYQTFHDGTWQGGRRAPEATHGDAWLESRPKAIKKSMQIWKANKTCEPGLVVGSIGSEEIVRPFVNAILFGAPGSGKTRRVLLPTVAELIASKRASVFMLDPKGEGRHYTSSFAIEKGIPVFDIQLDEPARSMRYDLLGTARRAIDEGDVGLCVAHLRELAVTLIPEMPGPNKYFSDAAREVFVGLATWLLENPDIPSEHKHMGSILAMLKPKDGQTAAERIMALAESLPEDDPASAGLSGITGSNTGSDNVISNLITAINEACDERVSRMLHNGEVDFAELGRKPSICYLSFSTDAGNYGRLTTAIVSQALAALRGEAKRNGGTLPIPVYFVLEEFGQLDPIKRLVADAGIMRSEGIHLLIVLQDRHQLEAKGYSKAEVEALLGMVDDSCILKLNDIETASMLSKRLGVYTVRTQSQSSTKAYNGGSFGTSYQTAKRELVNPSELTEWNADIGLLLIGSDGNYAIPCPDLSKRFVNKLLGMGDENHNRKIRLDAQYSAELRNPSKPSAWKEDVAGPIGSERVRAGTVEFDPLA